MPGTSVVVSEPAHGVVTDVLPCENGPARDHSLFGALLKTVQAGEIWIADCNCCTRDLLCDIDKWGGVLHHPRTSGARGRTVHGMLMPVSIFLIVQLAG